MLAIRNENSRGDERHVRKCRSGACFNDELLGAGVNDEGAVSRQADEELAWMKQGENADADIAIRSEVLGCALGTSAEPYRQRKRYCDEKKKDAFCRNADVTLRSGATFDQQFLQRLSLARCGRGRAEARVDDPQATG